MGKSATVDTNPNPVLNAPKNTNPLKNNSSKDTNVCCWNIRRGLIVREQELIEIIKVNDISVIFLVETDTVAINTETDFTIDGFKTIIQNKTNITDVTRIIGLVRNDLAESIIIRMDLTSKEFPSLWLELETIGSKNVLMGGFYREWAPKQNRSVEAQTTAMKIFTQQIEAASAEHKSIIILGDANLCCESWDAPQFQHKTVANELRETLVQCGLQVSKLGFTYTADHLSTNGEEIKSALDHIYYSGDLEQKLKMTTIPCSATDHSPIIAKLITNGKKQRTTNCQKTVTKRSMKNFTQTRWIDALRSRDWSKISSLKDVNEMTEEFTLELTKALDECAPLKKFKIRDHYKPGITQKAKLIMQERDSTRKKISSAPKEEKPKLQAKYRQLRNRAVNQIRRDTIQRNGDRIAKANNEGEMWRIVNEIVKPKTDNPFVINSPEGPITEDDVIANTFNKFFVDKIESLKEKIDPSTTSDPLTRVRNKFANSNLKFKLKPVTVNQVVKSMKGMSKKKSKGKDGIPQDCLLMGLEVLAAPLTEVVNRSIITGIVPEAWKAPSQVYRSSVLGVP